MTQPLHLPGLGPLSPSRPFDWDRDQPVMLAARAVQRPAPVAISARPGAMAPRTWRGLLLTSALGVAFLSGVALERGLWQMANARNFLVTSLGANTPLALPLLPDSVPQELVIYDAAQYGRFLAGLRQMSMADLLAYAGAVRRDLNAAPAFMAPFHKDALFVIEAEIALRQARMPAAAFSVP